MFQAGIANVPHQQEAEPGEMGCPVVIEGVMFTAKVSFAK
jgi:hypothetical protein